MFDIYAQFINKAWKLVPLKRRLVWIGVCLFLCLLVCFNYTAVDISYGRWVAQAEKDKVEKPIREELLSFANNLSKKSLITKKTIKPTIKNKFFIIFSPTRKEDQKDLNSLFSDEMIAKNRSELNTVVYITDSFVPASRYSDGSQGFYVVNTITMIDVASETITYTDKISGPMPPSSKQGRGSVYGSYPMLEVEKYLKEIPKS